MLPRRNRLHLRVDFQKVLKLGKTSHGRFYAFSVVRNEEKVKKIGQIVSNKISKLATERNFIRRAIRFAAGKSLASLPEGTLAVFLAKKEAVGQPFKVLVQEAESLLAKVQ